MAQKEKILVIEASAPFGDDLAGALYRDGYTSSLVRNGAEAISAMQSYKPNLVILDIALSGVGGYDILAAKQKDPDLAKIPLFLISIQGIPINMRQVPHDAVTEFVVSMQADPMTIVDRINRFFKHSLSSAAPAVAPASGGKKKILWVEDDKLIGTILGKKLISSGFDLLHAKSGEDALKSLTTFIPDAIVLDILLPGMNGFDILQKIRMNDATKKIPSMFLSNLSKPSDIEKAKMLGATKFVVKAAASLDEIVGDIRELCRA